MVDFHRQMENVRKKSEANLSSRGVIITDSVFSMDGDLAELPELADAASNTNSLLMVDDAHAIGVLGKTGAGSTEYFGLDQDQVPVLIGTFGKALGVAGAFVAGRTLFIEWLVQKARNYIYTTAMPPAQAVAVSKSIDLARTDNERRDHLFRLIAHFKERKREFAFVDSDESQRESETAIQPLVIGDAAITVQLSEALRKRGFLVVAIRQPTVPVGTARLRVSLSAAHSIEDVDRLCDAIIDEARRMKLFL
jgi:8-amino-7-oxononanoate synthase